MGVVIDEIEVDAIERETRSAPRETAVPVRAPPRLDPYELMSVLRKHSERLQRLWAD